MRFASRMTALTVVFSVLAGGAALAADAKKLRLGTEGAYPPFNFTDSSGKVIGFDVDVGLALCAQMKVECEVVAQDWDGIIPGLIAEKYDFIIASMSITEERKKQVAFTDPYYLSAVAMVAPKDSKLKEFTPAAMKGKTIGVQAGTTQADYAKAVYKDSEIREYPTQDEVNLDLTAGRMDAQIGDYLPMLDWVSKKDGDCCKLVSEPITDEKYVGVGTGIAIRQGDKQLLADMNAALAEIRKNGVYEKINAKYFPIDMFTMKPLKK